MNTELMLAEDMARFYDDPLGFVMYAYPWDKDSALQVVRLESPWRERFGCEFGPDSWACEVLQDIGEQVRKGKTLHEAIRMAISSGHGIGKSALVAWLVDWIMSTRPHAKGVVTANTGPQLESKTWAEIAKWTKRCITGHWFDVSTGKGSMRMVHRQNPESWRCDAQTCREENSEAFAGLHAASSTPFYIYDEASAIPDKIWEVSEGGMTDGEPMWFAFGNPTRNSGRFRECFGRLKHRWITRQIDSRTVQITNKAQIGQWVADYGEDSDFVRVRVRGIFPRAGSTQFIGSGLVDEAMNREALADVYDPLVLGVDVARFGDDESVIYIRKGRDGRSHPPLKFRGLDTMQLASRVAEQYEFYRADAVFVDGTGVGGGVVDRLRQLRVPVIDVQFGSKADRSNPGAEQAVYANKRAEMWGWMRDWLKGGAIPDDPDLRQQLEGCEYGFVLLQGQEAIALERKADMKKRGLPSPDMADALALTFAYPVMASRQAGRAGAGLHARLESEYDPIHGEGRAAVHHDYDPLAV